MPVMLNMSGRTCMIIGGGKVAKRKVASLLETDADIVVISPQFDEQLEQWGQEKRIGLVRHSYQGMADLIGAALVFAATDQDLVNEQIVKDAIASGILVSDASTPERGTFQLPAVLRRGQLVMSVSTGGASPALAASLRDQLRDQIGLEYAEYVSFLAEYRQEVLNRIADPCSRNDYFRRVLTYDIVEAIRSGQLNEFRKKLWAELVPSDEDRSGQQ